ncbi:DUF4307 domain-containing protein [Corynebacterium sp. ES2794-CONJ1]|uniref:DUF4307 domain-containing protein n=1 Tax=unclassified Corynebacterium TaxID=2624378 RepID=UPI00216923A5|nr:MULTISPECIES: DUF4307 domain-containing protein [unclassified Corynebacterium]MCS4489941.1 DUF4307 domain-containing protein [Corynebacterium sp. ES2775-CONJ]MCS4491696.1 DUF4307 domain-containing protein [Corynebacterium sp. ES2715-CONJ3]MCS4531801.1 DUF4307 domain-containing protein [Corynebacterium sp. ES2730-CONJ]MCU9519197.1 DUF4307 domain-containing protein [Corynebacterium sp. ES2794-CONJ1]
MRSRYAAEPKESQSSMTGKLMAIAILVLVIGFAVAFAKYLQTAQSQPITIQFVNAEPINDENITVIADITRKDTSQPAYCIVTALNFDMAEVGRREVFVPAGGQNIARWNINIPTRERAVAGAAYGCSDSIPFYLEQKAP